MNENRLQNKSFSPPNDENIMYSFHLVLFSDSDEIYELWLPKICEGYYRFSESNESRFLSISAKNGQWVVECKQPAFFNTSSFDRDCCVQLNDRQLLEIYYEDRTYVLYSEELTRSSLIFKNYHILPDIELSIGSCPDCDIYCNNPYLSDKQAVLIRSNGAWKIRDCNSKFGTYINGKRYETKELSLGDLVYLMGLRIIIGPSFLSIADSTDTVRVNPETIEDTALVHSNYSSYYEQDTTNNNDSYFNRSPRKRFELPKKTIVVEGPPMSMDRQQMPLLLRMGSSMVMSGAAVLAGNFMSLFSSVLFPVLTSKYTDKQKKDYEHLRITKYTEYLNKKSIEIDNECENEHLAYNRKYPTLANAIEIAKQKTHLWERRPADNDFLHLRLGTGTCLLQATIDYPSKSFELESDFLENQIYQLVETPHYVQNMPITLSLIETTVCGILGQRNQVVEYILKLALQLAIFHSYDEVKMFFFLNSDDLEQMECIKYLPHVWDDQRSTRFIACNEAEAYTLGEYIQEQLAKDKQGETDYRQLIKSRPYYLIFALDKKLIESHEIIKEILQSDTNRGVSVIAAIEDLPKESQKIITLDQFDGSKNICTTMDADGGEDTFFTIDDCDQNDFADTMRLLANTSLKTVAQAQAIPKMVTFLEMFKTGRIEQLNPLKRWKENNPVKSLATPVGVGSDGSLFMLDLHEKRQGPHGLVAGMTGSGKSEFIITYILSMAVNYHPDEVAFVLIDYKGGGLADAFENPRTGVKLPHLAGTITNLDGSSIQRSLMSIESELVRRQKVFSEVSKRFDEGSMNIYTYQKLYRAGKVSEPMPHLFIISDEFAELKQQQPEFMEKLISAARIGRSLGVHLILATQKPSGVVNDQIRSNTKFRVCLRVQDRADSMDMLKRPEAAELTDTGRFYLQVGYNEYFALGQSAWCGADYEPQDSIPVQRDDAIEFLDITGQVVTQNKPKVKKISSGMKQIGAVVQYLSKLAESQNISVRPLCTAPLTTNLDFESIPDTTDYEVPDTVEALVGMIDDPEKQTQFPFMLPLQKYQNLLVVGNSGSGKTTFLKTMLYSLTYRYSPDNVNYYILDFSGGTLGIFRNTPHCGAVLTEHDESSIDRFLQMLRNIIKERRGLFKQIGVTSFESCKENRKIPLILVVIDNASGMSTLKNGNTYFSTLHEYIKEASGLGIKFVISCNNLNEVSTRTRQEITNRIALQLKDKYAYADVLGKRCDNVPLTSSGRGMCVYSGKIMEFQTAVPFIQQSEVDRMHFMMRELEKNVQQDIKCTSAKKLPVIDPEESYEAFCRDIPDGRIPLGYDLQNIKKVSIPFAQLYTAGMFFGKENAAAPLLDNIIFAAHKNGMELVFVKNHESLLDGKLQETRKYPDLRVFSNTKQSSLDLCYLLVDEIKKRKVFRNEYCIEHGIPLEQAKNPEIVKKASSYIRSKTKPLMIIFEDLCEFGANLEDGTFSVYEDILRNGKGYNFYFFSCFYPHNSEKAAKDLLTRTFGENALLLLYGGNLQKQTLTVVPAEYKRNALADLAYNQFLMRYNGTFYPMVMPCREPDADDIDPDEKSII